MEATTKTYGPQKFHSLQQAVDFARKDSQEKETALFVIRDIQQECYYVDDDALIRSFEKLVATFDNGKRIYD